MRSSAGAWTMGMMSTPRLMGDVAGLYSYTLPSEKSLR